MTILFLSQSEQALSTSAVLFQSKTILFLHYAVLSQYKASQANKLYLKFDMGKCFALVSCLAWKELRRGSQINRSCGKPHTLITKEAIESKEL